MDFIDRKDLVRLISLQSGYKNKDVASIVSAYETVVKECLLRGFKVRVSGIGHYTLRYNDAKPERTRFNPREKRDILLPPQPPYNSPIFKMSSHFRQEVKDTTLGDAF